MLKKLSETGVILRGDLDSLINLTKRYFVVRPGAKGKEHNITFKDHPNKFCGSGLVLVSYTLSGSPAAIAIDQKKLLTTTTHRLTVYTLELD